MERPTMILADHVYMKFNLSSEKFDSFKEYVIKSIKKQVSFDEFWALKDVDVYKRQLMGAGYAYSLSAGVLFGVLGVMIIIFFIKRCV